MLGRIFGRDEDEENKREPGNVVIRVEVNGKTYTQRYADMEMAQIRFPQYLADLAALQSRQSEE